MASIRERYRDIYEELKAHGPRYVDEQNLEPEVERELLDLIEKLPHPDVVTAWDVQDICDRIRAGELEWFYELVGEDAGALLQELGDIEEPGYSEEVDPRTISKQLAYQRTMLSDISGSVSALRGSTSQMHRQLDLTLKGVCPDCGEDLRITVDSSRSPDALKIECRNSNCRVSPDWRISSLH